MQSLLKHTLALAAFGLGLFGRGIEPAHASFTIFCQNQITATWTGAAFGRTDHITRTLVRLTFVNPTTTLLCAQPPPTPNDVLTQVVQLSPGAIPALCGGKVQLSMQGGTAGGVPPFGGFVFDTTKIPATPTYNQATGRCQLDVAIGGLALGVIVSKACSKAAINGWTCPSDVQPVGALVRERDSRLAKTLLQAPWLAAVLARYEGLAAPRSAALQQLLTAGRPSDDDT